MRNRQLLSYVSACGVCVCVRACTHVCSAFYITVPFFTFHLDVILALDHQLDSDWREFGTFLYVTPSIMDGISKDNSHVKSCMLRLVEKWLVCENGTGDLPRTWQTVVQAVKNTGKGLLAEQLAEQHGVQLCNYSMACQTSRK